RWDAETARTAAATIVPLRTRRPAAPTRLCETRDPKRRTTDTPTCRAWKELASSSNDANDCCEANNATPAEDCWDCHRPAIDARHTYKSVLSTTARRMPAVERGARHRSLRAAE